MVKYDNGTLPPNLWSVQVEECPSGDMGMFHQREDIKLISLAKDFQDQMDQNAYLLRFLFLFFFFLTLKNKHFCSSQISTFLKAKEYAEFPQVSEKKKNKARIKICRISSYIYLPLQLQPLFLHSVHTKTHIHTPYIQPFKHLKRKDHFIWSIRDKQDKVLFRNSQLQIQRVLIYKRS